MSNLEMIERLCQIVEEQARIIRALNAKLTELNCVILADEIASSDKAYVDILGADEAPDKFYCD